MLWRVASPLLILAAATGVAAALWVNRDIPQPNIVEPPILNVDAVLVRPQTVQLTIAAQGVAKPRTETMLTAEVSGQVTYVAPEFVPGGRFKRNDLLLRIDERNYTAALKSRQAAVARAKAALALERSRAKVALQEWRETQKLPSLSPLQGARDLRGKALALRKPQLDQAKAELESALAELQQAQIDHQRTRFHAPYDGIVRERLVDLGRYLVVGSQIGSIFATDAVEIRLPLPENRISYLDLPDRRGAKNKPSQLPKVILRASVGGKTHRWPGRLVRSEGVFDQASQTLYVVAQVDDPYQLRSESAAEPLRVGTFVNATLTGKQLDGLVVLPRHVLRAGNRLWIVDDSLRLRLRDVEPLHLSGEYVYIASGLSEGELVCLTPLGNVLPGTLVRVLSQKPSSRWAHTAGLPPEEER